MENDLYYCQRCNSNWMIPSDLTDSFKKKCAELAGTDSTKEAIELLKKEKDMTQHNAKETVLHIARPGQKCQWCTTVLEALGMIVCSRCKALNLVW